jgi:predicted RNA-binding protein with PUA-like domain
VTKRPLAEIKKDPKLANMLLVKNSRISVMSVTEDEYDQVVAMGN